MKELKILFEIHLTESFSNIAYISYDSVYISFFEFG